MSFFKFHKTEPLPFDAKIGSYITVNKSALISAEVSGSIIGPDTDFGTSIQSISSVLFDGMTEKAFRYYTSNGDDDNHTIYIEVFDKSALLLVKSITSIYPNDEEEQALFLGEAEPDGLGSQKFSLYREQFEELGEYSNEKLDSIFGNSNELIYTRYINPIKPFIDPLHGLEKRVDDEYGKHGIHKEIYFMSYTRPLTNGDTEFLLIETQLAKEDDGEISYFKVNFNTAIILPKESITIQ